MPAGSTVLLCVLDENGEMRVTTIITATRNTVEFSAMVIHWNECVCLPPTPDTCFLPPLMSGTVRPSFLLGRNINNDNTNIFKLLRVFKANHQ